MVVMTVAGKKLAVGRTEITLGDFRRYWNARGSKTRAARPSCRDRESFFRTSKTRTFQSPFDKPELAQDAEHPVVCVSWDDAADYVKWLSTESGKRYRLPSAAEFGSLAQGARPAACKSNLADQRYDKVLGEREGASCDDGYAATAKVKSYETDSGPLYDIAGNVREWVSDCAGACKTHLALGAAWLTVPGKGDGVPRESFDADLGLTTVGFRVVREVE
jgi:formylglycine-generating enzyme required for sulfatase activity